MSKVISLVLLSILVLSGCTPVDEPEKKGLITQLTSERNNDEQQTAVEKTCSDEIKRGQSATCEGITINFIKYSWDRKASIYSFDYSLTNNRQASFEFTPAKSMEAKYFSSANVENEYVFSDDDQTYQIEPGQTVAITSAFTLPNGDDMTEIQIAIENKSIVFKNIV